MSCFIVSKECVNRLLSWLDYNRHDIALSGLESYGLKFDDSEGEDPMGNLGKKIIRMNVAAFETRYGDEPRAAKSEVADFFWTGSSKKVSDVQAYTDVSCILYQCTEGTVPLRRLYRALEALKAAIASKIIRDLPEGKSAIWG